MLKLCLLQFFHSLLELLDRQKFRGDQIQIEPILTEISNSFIYLYVIFDVNFFQVGVSRR